MPHVEAHILDVLKKELSFLEHGGYRDPDRWSPALIFEDSPTCMHPDRSLPRPCEQCPLMLFVPESRWRAPVPCRYIPLNEEGYTLENMYRMNSNEEIEATVKAWLGKTIARFERIAQADQTPSK